MPQYVSIHFQLTGPAGSGALPKQTYCIPVNDPVLEAFLSKVFGDLANMLNMAGSAAQNAGPGGKPLPYNPLQAGHANTSFPPQ